MAKYHINDKYDEIEECENPENCIFNFHGTKEQCEIEFEKRHSEIYRNLPSGFDKNAKHIEVYGGMEFEWSILKNLINLKKHKVDFQEAKTIFPYSHTFDIYDEDHSDDENRFNTIGFSRGNRELTVCYCERNGGKRIRIITARKATKGERKMYYGKG